MLGDMFEGLVAEPNRPEPVDYANMSRSSLKTILFNQLIAQAMCDNPQPSILALAVKVVGVDGSDAAGDAIAELSTAELVERVRGLM